MESTKARVQSALLTAVDELYQQLAALKDFGAVPKATDEQQDRTGSLRRCAASTGEAL